MVWAAGVEPAYSTPKADGLPHTPYPDEFTLKWSGRLELNQHKLAPETSGLPHIPRPDYQRPTRLRYTPIETGCDEGSRTHDLMVMNHALYQLSYATILL